MVKRARNTKLVSIFFTASASILKIYRKYIKKNNSAKKIASIIFTVDELCVCDSKADTITLVSITAYIIVCFFPNELI